MLVSLLVSVLVSVSVTRDLSNRSMDCSEILRDVRGQKPKNRTRSAFLFRPRKGPFKCYVAPKCRSVCVFSKILQIDRLAPKFAFRLTRPLRRTVRPDFLISTPKGAIQTLRNAKMPVCLRIPQNCPN